MFRVFLNLWVEILPKNNEKIANEILIQQINGNSKLQYKGKKCAYTGAS